MEVSHNECVLMSTIIITNLGIITNITNHHYPICEIIICSVIVSIIYHGRRSIIAIEIEISIAVPIPTPVQHVSFCKNTLNYYFTTYFTKCVGCFCDIYSVYFIIRYCCLDGVGLFGVWHAGGFTFYG